MGIGGEELALMEELPERPFLIDGGMGWGNWTGAALAARPLATVVGFEPEMRNGRDCRVRFRGDPRVQVIGVALGDRDEYRTIEVAPSQDLGSSMKLRACRKSRSRLTRVRPLAEVIERTPDLVKLDVEGWELPALIGMGDLRPKLIQFEYGGAWGDSGHALDDAYDLLEKRGYRIRNRVPDNGEFANIVAELVHLGR